MARFSQRVLTLRQKLSYWLRGRAASALVFPLEPGAILSPWMGLDSCHSAASHFVILSAGEGSRRIVWGRDPSPALRMPWLRGYSRLIEGCQQGAAMTEPRRR